MRCGAPTKSGGECGRKVALPCPFHGRFAHDRRDAAIRANTFWRDDPTDLFSGSDRLDPHFIEVGKANLANIKAAMADGSIYRQQDDSPCGCEGRGQ